MLEKMHIKNEMSENRMIENKMSENDGNFFENSYNRGYGILIYEITFQ